MKKTPDKPKRYPLADLRRRGFDACRPLGGGRYRVRCSQCSAIVINGVACHESGCLNRPRPEVDE
jgi:hypothetical protein